MKLTEHGSVRFVLVVLMCALAFAFASCSKSSVKLYPVHGQVLFKDQPAEGAQVVFRPAQESGEGQNPPMAYGTVEKDGKFTLRTEPHGEGAPAGDYAVLITWYDTDPNDALKHVSKLPAKYADQLNPLIKVTVKEGNNDLEPFRLKP